MNLLIYFFISLVLIIFSYFFIDAPLVLFVHSKGINKLQVIEALTHIPDLIIALLIIFIILVPFLFKFMKGKKLFHLFFMSTLSVCLAAQVKDILKFVFGRYWPNTWVDNNLSLIVNNSYGFNFFHKGSAFASFPSGHATVTCAFFAMCVFFYPRFKFYFFIPIILLSIGLILTHYHFFSDVVAGMFLGWSVAKLVYDYFHLYINKNNKL